MRQNSKTLTHTKVYKTAQNTNNPNCFMRLNEINRVNSGFVTFVHA